MDKITYLTQLAEGLARWVPERERENILRYYAEYFEEAGPDRESDVVRELGDPWALSSRLAVEGGYVTREGASDWTPRKKRKWPWVAAGCAAAAVVASLVIPIASGIGRFLGRTVSRTVGDSVANAVDEVRFGPTYERADSSGDGFWTREDGGLEAFRSIEADISLGNITITAGEDYSLSIQREMDLGGFELKWRLEDGVLKIEDGSSGGHLGLEGLGALGGKALDVDITVPEGETLIYLDVSTNLGDVLLTGINVEDTLSASTDLGDVECYETVAVLELELETDMGNIDLALQEMWPGAEIDLSTSMGNVSAVLGCAESECAYELETDLGSVTVDGAKRGASAQRGGNSSYHLSAESDMGDVNVSFSGS